MIHILLLILKIIGLLLLGLLALILVLLLVILLTPLKCTLKAGIDNSLESAEGKIRFHWMFHLISGEAAWQDGKFTWFIRAAWKKFSSEGVEAETGSENAADRPHKSRKPENEKRAEEHRADISSASGPSDTAGTASKSAEGAAAASEEAAAAAQEKEPSRIPENRDIQENGDKPGTGPGKLSRIRSFITGIKSGFERIKYTFQHLCDNIKSLSDKKERITRFLSEESHQRAFARLIREVRGLLRRLSPDRASINITFGFEDPSHTGYTLAGISLIYPAIGEYTSLTPDFEHKVLKGDIYIKEKIRLIYAVIFAWNMLIDKNVRMTYRHLRKFKW